MKNTISDLALFGGAPAFEESLYVGRPNLGDRRILMERIEDILDRRWLTNNGRYVQEFERRLCEWLGVRHCVAVCNATVALEILVRALGLSGEVILPSFTFVATAHALAWQGVTPVFCDVNLRTHQLDPAEVERCLSPHTSAILGVHLWGELGEIEALAEIAARHRLRLIFDAAHALGCGRPGRRIGNFGDAEVFSFHATKCLNSFEGGVIATNDTTLAERLRKMRNFGFEDYDCVTELGTNGKMTEVCAAMGVTSLESRTEILADYARNYRRYCQELKDVPGVRLYRFCEREPRNYAYIVLETLPEAVLSRDQIVALLHAERVAARRYFSPGCHAMEPYRTRDPEANQRLPHTERLARTVFTLPTGTTVSEDEITRLCALLRWILERGTEIERRWQAVDAQTALR